MKQTILYIGGYGRSGSTLLERILASHPQIEGLGEVSYMTRSPDIHESICGCGRPLGECPLWGPVFRKLEAEFDFEALRAEQLKSDAWRPFSLSGVTPEPASTYRRFLTELFEAVSDRVYSEVRYLVDSSKTARENVHRPDSLIAAGHRVKLIHLVRDGRGCIWSYMGHGSDIPVKNVLVERVPLPALRVSVGWMLGNDSAERFAREHPDDYIQLRYEDFVSAPADALERLGEFLDVDLSPQRRKLAEEEPFPTLHQLAGNRLRHKAVVGLKPDTEWQERLPSAAERVFRLMNGRRAERYGYPRRAAAWSAPPAR